MLRAGMSPVLFFLIALGLGGCASPPTTRLARVHMEFPLRVVAVQAPMDADAGRLQEVFADDVKQPLTLADPRLAQAVREGQARAASAMEAALRREPDVVLLPSGAAGQPEIARIEGQDFESPLTPDETERLRAATGADALLRYGITDYGLTPRTWRKGYIAFEVATTVALAAVIAYSGSKAAQAAAVLYLVQEAAEETASAYATFQAFDEIVRPVRMQAELIRLHPLARAWHTAHTGFSDIKLSRYFRKVDGKERDAQLATATRDAAQGVVDDLHWALEYGRMMQGLHAY